LVLIPNVIPKTPAFVDQVRSDSLAQKSGVLPNDLILMINDQRIDSQKSLQQVLLGIERSDSFQILLQRGTELIRTQVRP
jgi:serine protease Do